MTAKHPPSAVDVNPARISNSGPQFGRLLLFLSIVLPIGVLVGGWLVYERQRTEFANAAKKALAASVDLRAEDIANWMKERRGDAEVARSSEVIHDLLANPGSAAARASASAQIGIFRRVYGYDAIILTDAAGKVVMKQPEAYPLQSAAVANHIQLALRSPRVVVSDLRQDPMDQPIHLWVSCPIFARFLTSGDCIGALLLVVDPNHFIYSTVQRQTAPSRTSEAFLVLYEQGTSEYLNLGDFNRHSAPVPGEHLSDQRSLPSLAARGEEGAFDTTDQRGVPVVAAIRKIAGTPWAIVAKVDQEEVFSQLSRQAWNVGLIDALVLVITSLGLGLSWRQQRLTFLRRELEERRLANESLQASEQRFRTLFERAPIAFSITRKGTTLHVNRKYLELYGYGFAEDVSGTAVIERWAPELREMIADRIRKRALGEPVPNEYEGMAQRKDGSQFHVHVAVSTVELPDGPASLAVLADISERIQAAETVTLFKTLVDHANDAIEVIDPVSGRFLDVNARSCEMHGYSREEYLSFRIIDLDSNFAATGEEMLRQQIAKIKESGAQIFETEHRRKDGSVFPVEINASYVSLGRDYIIAVVRDITERKRVEQHIRHLNRVYAVLSEINQLIVRERNPQVMLETACRIAVELGEYQMAWVAMENSTTHTLVPVASAGVVEGYLDDVRIDLNDPARVVGPTGRAFTTGEHQVCGDIENDPKMKPWADSALRRGYRSSAAFPLVAGGKVAGVFTLYAAKVERLDVDEIRLLDELAGDMGVALELHQQDTDRRRAETEIRDNEERFRVLIENAADIITVINHAGIFRFVSPSVKRSLGYEPAELLDRVAFGFIEPLDVPRLGRALQRLIDNPTISIVEEFRFRHRDGTWRTLQTVGRSIANQAPDGFLVINARDVTETRKLEEQFRQAQKMEAIGQLAGGVAHDFNNILAVIMMQSQLSAMGDLPPKVRDGLLQISGAAERAARLTRQLLMFSRKQVMQARDLNVNEVVASLAIMLQRLIGADVKMTLQLHPAPLITHADAGMLEQVLMNLVVNARDAMPHGGQLRIETAEQEVDARLASLNPEAQPGRYARLSVSDSGTGIPPDVLPRIFEPFFTTKEPGKGTGLGLATTFGIIKQHRGLITVESKLGEGTQFHVLLPFSVTARLESAPSANAPSPQRGHGTILLVEDEEMVRSLTREVLEGRGYRVIELSNGVDAVKFWEGTQEEIHLLLTDLVMPGGISGSNLAERLRQDKPQLRTIFVSGYSPDVAGKNIELKLGENFLQKPFSADQLLEMIRRALGN